MQSLESDKNTSKTKKISPTQMMVLGFASIICMGAILLNLPIASQSGESIGLLDAFFTATSAVCVTGLIVVDTATHWTVFGQLVIIILIQIGGIGFMTVATMFALIARKKINLKERLLIQESFNQFNLSGLVKLTKHVFLITLTIEIVGAMTLMIEFVPRLGLIKGIWYSLFHSISAFCNAGFDLMGAVSGPFTSLTSFVGNPIVMITISLLIVLGGLGFPVILDIMKNRKYSKLNVNSKVVLSTTMILIIMGTITIFVLEFNNANTVKSLGFGTKVLASIFQSITARTAGFNSIDLAVMHEAGIFIIIMLMFIGASPASTGGGVKTSTLATIVLYIKSFIMNKDDVDVFERRIETGTIRKAITIFSVGIVIVTVGTLMLLVIQPKFTFIESMFEIVSAFTTAGLSIGGSPNLNIAGKMLIIMYMFLGRVGSLTVFMAFISRKKSKNYNIRYPEGKVLVG